LLIGFNSPLVLGHNFSPDESANFLGLVDIIKGEAQSVQDDLASKNVSLANQHANRALALVTDNVTKEIAERNPRLSDDLKTTLITLKSSSEPTPNPSTANDINFTVSDLNGILDEIVTARIDPEKLSNSTIQALRLVEILDGVLRNYGDAYAVGFDMTNMSMMMGNVGGGMSSMDMGDMSSSQQYKLVNMTDYHTAKILAQKVQELFNNRLANASISGTPATVTNDITVAFQELSSSINDRASPMDIMMIVHTKIHPNLMSAFGLQLGNF
jgi:hypothetical protein